MGTQFYTGVGMVGSSLRAHELRQHYAPGACEFHRGGADDGFNYRPRDGAPTISSRLINSAATGGISARLRSA
jgi:hypothetical protein